ncbi:nucleotidyltransferase family protein [Butyrivibrio sp. VCB2006]|uniref:nucleotidyltransferase family protein n=1 Tax=Butyrivibrio sp. VCB2006 TaxID=1280679 RepID=UPI000407326C|nr:nucleotidyltransferase family protein [Butyrivibrio sp. VCB2006]
MKCIILAAGYATRLYPLTENFPKPLLKVGDKAILDWLIDDIKDQIDEFVVVSNHKFAGIFEEWARERGGNITIVDDGTISNETRLGAVKDIQLAAKEANIKEDCLVMAGDNLLDFSLQKFVDFAVSKDASCVMCHEENRLEALRKTAVITMEEDGKITSYEEKPMEPKGNHAVPPFYFYKAEDLGSIQDALDDGCGYDAPGSFAAWLSRQKTMYAFVMPGKRYDIGDVESYENVKKVFEK